MDVLGGSEYDCHSSGPYAESRKGKTPVTFFRICERQDDGPSKNQNLTREDDPFEREPLLQEARHSHHEERHDAQREAAAKRLRLEQYERMISERCLQVHSRHDGRPTKYVLIIPRKGQLD